MRGIMGKAREVYGWFHVSASPILTDAGNISKALI
jgi:hypothetical protein